MASAVVAVAGDQRSAMAGTGGLEQKKFEYFSSISPMARKIMLEKQKIREKYGPRWDSLDPREQEEIIDCCMVEPQVRGRYSRHRVSREEAASYPRLQLQTGQKIVHFGEEVRLRGEGMLPRSRLTRLPSPSTPSLPAFPAPPTSTQPRPSMTCLPPSSVFPVLSTSPPPRPVYPLLPVHRLSQCPSQTSFPVP